MSFKKFGAIQSMIYHQKIAVHAIGKQRQQGKYKYHQAKVLKIVGHFSMVSVIRRINEILIFTVFEQQ